VHTNRLAILNKVAHRKKMDKMENEKKKYDRVVFYLTKTDKEMLFNQCSLLNIKPSFYVRNIVLEKLGKPIFETPKTNIETENYLKELMRQGANLNQIARKLNSNEKFLIADQQEVLDSIALISKQILQLKTDLK
jgi:mobilization protein NikA